MKTLNITKKNVEAMLYANRSACKIEEIQEHFACGDKQGKLWRLDRILDTLVEQRIVVSYYMDGKKVYHHNQFAPSD